jgi:16S rRNA (uracil1498-N3)-methyltransferase
LATRLIIEGEELQHIFAKRVKVGQELELFFEDKLYLCSLEKLTQKGAFCIVIKELELATPLPFITLYQCVPVELKTMDFIVEKVSEVGAYRLVPTLSKRSFQNIPSHKQKNGKVEEGSPFCLQTVQKTEAIGNCTSHKA